MDGFRDEFVIENGYLKKYNGCCEDVVIPDGVTVIGSGAFTDNKSVRSVDMPYGLRKIEENAFSGCSNLYSVRIPKTVTSLGFAAFHGCGNLQDFVFYPDRNDDAE